jgi:hypothetical protein
VNDEGVRSGMKRAIHANPMAMAGLVIVGVGWLWLALLLASHFNLRYAAQWWVEGAAYACYMFSPVALLLGAGALVWEDDKRMSWWAIVLSVVSLALVLWIRP